MFRILEFEKYCTKRLCYLLDLPHRIFRHSILEVHSSNVFRQIQQSSPEHNPDSDHNYKIFFLDTCANVDNDKILLTEFGHSKNLHKTNLAFRFNKVSVQLVKFTNKAYFRGPNSSKKIYNIGPCFFCP